MRLKKVDHIAIICSDFEKSKAFYINVLGMQLIMSEYREARRSHRARLSLNGNYLIELFTFPESPKRVDLPEACGLRHLAFAVDNLNEVVAFLGTQGISTEDIRFDLERHSRYVFFKDPDGLPIELYEG